MRSPDGSRSSDYDYALPPGRVALYPAEHRDESRLLVMGPAGGFDDLRFRDIVGLIEPGDVLVLNRSRVLPARLLGHKTTGAPAEILLVRPAPARDDPYVWEALVRPGSKLKPGRTVVVGDDLHVEILDSAPGSGRTVRLVTESTLEQALDSHGHVPLPPYIDRPDEPLDRERYQTVYAREPGSVAAPTAGLHFTHEVLAALEEKRVLRAEITLHVGVGTFRPVDADDPAEHRMHHEMYTIPAGAAATIATARAGGGRVWAVGTTVVRTLESAALGGGGVASGSGATDLFIRPPFAFQIVDCMLTNFHLPRSTLLMLVAAFAGYDRAMAAYAEAIALGYRFYSYGDAMAVLRDR